MAHDLIMAAAGVSSGPSEYVEDVFSTTLYTGNGGTQTINNGIALASELVLPIGTQVAGGYFAGYYSDSTDGVATHALIVAPKSTEVNREWKPALGGGDPSSELDGQGNTAAMDSSAYPAAKYCADLTTGGFTDWYLPARYELDIAYQNLKPTTTNNSTSVGINLFAVPQRTTNRTTSNPGRTSVAIFQDGGSEAFQANDYWTSTQAGGDNSAGIVIFSSGGYGTSSKGNGKWVRAFRKISISDAALDPYRITGKGGLVWVKIRNQAYSHHLCDTARGANNILFSNLTNASAVTNTITGFTSSGFSVSTNSGADVSTNESGSPLVSWTFRKAPKFFDIVTWTGNGQENRSIAHSLGSVPGMIIVKAVNSGGLSWCIHHRSEGANRVGFFGTGAFINSSIFANTTPTATNFFVSGGAAVGDGTNANTVQYVAYLFAHNAGGFGDAGTDNIISCGSFTTDGTGNATVNLGYEPQYVMIKRTNSTGQWIIVDNMRGMNVPGHAALFANLSSEESVSGSKLISPTPTGFEAFSAASADFIYMAIRRPMKTPTSGTQVFAPTAYTANNSDNRLVDSGILTDAALVKRRNLTSNWFIANRLTGNNYLRTNSWLAEESQVDGFMTPTSGVGNSFSTMTGFGVGNNTTADVNTSSNTYIAYSFRRARGFFDVVTYTGNGANRDIPHNLGAVPQLILIKNRGSGGTNGTNWAVYMQANGNTNWTGLNNSDFFSPLSDSTFWNNTSPTSTTFRLGTNSQVNANGGSFIAYLFGSVDGVSKVGTYSGNGGASNIQVNCGFSGSARFVLIKAVNSGRWFVFDTARGINSGNDSQLSISSPDAEFTNANFVNPLTGGFEVTTNSDVNSGGTYQYLAIA